MSLTLITPPVTEPVTVDEAKAHLRLEHALDDTFVGKLITAARQHVETVCWRALLPQTWELRLDEFPAGREISLAMGRVRSVTSLKYDDSNDAEQTVSPTDYIVDGAVPARLVLRRVASWPGTNGEANCVRVRYEAGYTDAADVPQSIKHGILLLISQMYEHRTPEVVGTIVSPVKFAFESLVLPHSLAPRF